MAADNVQPVPWLFEVFTPGCFNAMSGSSGRASQSVNSAAEAEPKCPPLDEDGLGAHIEELARGDVYVLFGVDLHVREQFRFGAVGRQEIGLGQNVPAQGIDRILAEEPLPALAYADGIDHKRELAPLQSGFDRFNDFGGEQHTGLGRGDGEAFPDRFELKPHKARFRGHGYPRRPRRSARSGR